VTDGKFAKMNSELKKIKEIGKMEWTCHGSASRPKLLQILVADAELPSGKSKVCQATVQVQLRQVLMIDEVCWNLQKRKTYRRKSTKHHVSCGMDRFGALD
jgi:hypothetical protein